MTEKEFLHVVHWTMPMLANFCKSYRGNYRAIMEFKREFQMALAAYSKHRKYDAVQDKSISIICKIEKWVKDIFVRDMVISIYKSFPQMNPTKAKNRARNLWEVYNRKMSY